MKRARYGKVFGSAIAVVLASWLTGTPLALSRPATSDREPVGTRASEVLTASPRYVITNSIPLGKPDTWDLLEFDPQSGRVYVTHSSEVDVLDGATGGEIGRVTGLRDVHGVVSVPRLGKGYVTEGGGNAVAEFDLSSLRVQRRIPTEIGPDALVYDSFTGRLFAMNGRSASATVIDTKSDVAVARVPLGGDPEAGVSDGRGDVYVNISSRSEVVRIDAASGSVNARWPLPGCQSPHGISMDSRTARLFVTCSNSTMVILDAHSGRALTSLPIGMFSDGCAFDPAHRLIYSSNGIGTLSVVRERGPNNFVVIADARTKPAARTMALNAGTGRVYMVASELDVHPQAQDIRRRYSIRPGTVQLLILDPK
jgi:DNA-binding beta-propeller fold protein YncE